MALRKNKQRKDILLFEGDVDSGAIIGCTTGDRQLRYRSKDTLVADPGISLATKFVYMLIMEKCHEKGYCWASNKRMASDFGCSKSAVSRAVSRLVEAGYVYSVVTRVKDRYDRKMYIVDRSLG